MLRTWLPLIARRRTVGDDQRDERLESFKDIPRETRGPLDTSTRLQGCLRGSLSLVELPVPDLALEKLIQLGSGASGRSHLSV